MDIGTIIPMPWIGLMISSKAMINTNDFILMFIYKPVSGGNDDRGKITNTFTVIHEKTGQFSDSKISLLYLRCLYNSVTNSSLWPSDTIHRGIVS